MPYLTYCRNYAFFLLAYYTGARPVELLALKLDSFTGHRGIVKIVGAKGRGKSRIFKLGEDLKKAVRDYIRECTIAGRSHELDTHFFLGNRKGYRWTYQ